MSTQFQQLQQDHQVRLQRYDQYLHELQEISYANNSSDDDEGFELELKDRFQTIIEEMNVLVEEILNDEYTVANLLMQANHELSNQLEYKEMLQDQQAQLINELELKRSDNEKAQILLEKVEDDIELQKLKEIKLCEEIKYYQKISFECQQKESQFLQLYNECSVMNDCVQEKNEMLDKIRTENVSLAEELQKLQEKKEQQNDQIHLLKIQNEKSEIIQRKLEEYQKLLKNLMQQQETEPKEVIQKFDPLEYIHFVQKEQTKEQQFQEQDESLEDDSSSSSQIDSFEQKNTSQDETNQVELQKTQRSQFQQQQQIVDEKRLQSQQSIINSHRHQEQQFEERKSFIVIFFEGSKANLSQQTRSIINSHMISSQVEYSEKEYAKKNNEDFRSRCVNGIIAITTIGIVILFIFRKRFFGKL